jgi:hypothetical protein
MCRRSSLSLIFGVYLAGCQATAPTAETQAEYIGSLRWQLQDLWFGGWSGLELSDNGTEFTVISDKGRLLKGLMHRDASNLSRIDVLAEFTITDASLPALASSDSEGLAIAQDGSIFASFEGINHVVQLSPSGSVIRVLPRHADFVDLQNNSGMEALAIDANGTLYTLPERSGAIERAFRVYAFENARWSIAFQASRTDDFLPVGADIGPDGKFYLLERDFNGLAFKTRVRRFELPSSGEQPGETLLTSKFGQHDNLEGISVWLDDAGAIRLTLVSDDNFRLLQRSEFVEYKLR